MDPAVPRVEAVLIADGRIVGVGSNEDVLSRAGAGARRLNLNGRTVVPGFNDCHMHVLPYGLDLTKADLSPAAGVTNVPELLVALRQWRDENPASEWVLGNRYDQNTFPSAAHPTRQELDAAFPDEPVFLTQTSKHAATANSVALKIAGVTRDTPDPEGGEIVLGPDGEPTGVLLESAMALVLRCMKKPGRSEMTAALHRANDAMLRAGITSASDLNTGWLDMRTEIEAYHQAAEGAPIRTTLFPHAPDFGKPEDIPERDEFEAECFRQSKIQNPKSKIPTVRLGAIKLFSDGALTVRTAALREPYVDGSGVGMLLHEPEELHAYIQVAHARGWQIAIHAIGDLATELVLDGYEAAQLAQPRSGARHRIEHAMLLDEALIGRFVKMGVIPVVQPEFLARLGDAYVLGLGEERAARLNPTATLQRAGIGVPFSSDCPIVPGAPLDGIRAAARRMTRSGKVLGPEERITPLDGLRNYTYWAAYSSFDEAETGTIAPGMRADLAILSADLTGELLDDVKVDATMIGGELVFGSETVQ